MAKKKISILLLSSFFLLHSSFPAYADEETILPFSDVEEDTKYYDSIAYLYDEGIISGYGDGTFKPNEAVNRVEALKILLLSANIEIQAETESTFSDVAGTEWFYPYLAEGLEKKIVSGYSDGTFQPENTVNMVEVLKMLVNTHQLIPQKPSADNEFFPDADPEAWYASYLYFGVENGLIYVDSEGNINPDKKLTRAELADIIYRYINLGYYSGEVGFGKATYYSDIFEGRSTASGETYFQNKMTAAHLTLPFGTVVRVTNINNGHTIEVIINDRGPYAEGHVLDLSKVAFQKLGTLSSGVLNIEYEIVNPPVEIEDCGCPG